MRNKNLLERRFQLIKGVYNLLSQKRCSAGFYEGNFSEKVQILDVFKKISL
jgi:hypothetical protein